LNNQEIGLSGGGEDDLTPVAALVQDGLGSDKEARAMTWILLICAGLLEVVWAYAMKRSEGFTHLASSIITLAAMAASFVLLALAMRTLPLGTAYTVWTGIGAVGAFVVGVAVLGEAATPMRVLAAALIVLGIALMKLTSAE
jgi:quaternary ammonium compound-resistance protein SugE